MIMNRISMWVAARMTCGLMLTTAVTLAMAQDGYAPGYNQTRVATQRAAMERAGMVNRQSGYPMSQYPSRAAYGAQVNRGRSAVRTGGAYNPAAERYESRPVQRPQSRSQGFVPQGEVRGGYEQTAERVSYNEGPEAIHEDALPVEPIPADHGSYQGEPIGSPYQSEPTYPVEVLEGSYEGGAEGCASCQSCGGGDGGGICDYNGRSKGCNREKCPCPSDEALSYYRCNFYGHYPTLWRSFPDGFLKYRPEQEPQTPHDRFRKAAKGPENAAANTSSSRDQDLDQQLKDLMNKEQQQKPGAPAAPNRAAPELLPENVAPPTPPTPPAPGPAGSSQYRSRSRAMPGAVSQARVTWQR